MCFVPEGRNFSRSAAVARSMTYPSRRARATTAGLALLAVALAPALQQLPAGAAAAADPAAGPGDSTTSVTTIGDPVPGLADLDVIGTARPRPRSSPRRAALGDVELRWNANGTPASILPTGGSLGRRHRRERRRRGARLARRPRQPCSALPAAARRPRAGGRPRARRTATPTRCCCSRPSAACARARQPGHGRDRRRPGHLRLLHPGPHHRHAAGRRP